MKNNDGSYSYPISVTFLNNITNEELETASSYITGGLNGPIQGAAYFFAPAGGTVSIFSASNGSKIRMETCNDLQLGFIRLMNVRPNQPVTITYTVTTAPGIETPLVFCQTPTAQGTS